MGRRHELHFIPEYKLDSATRDTRFVDGALPHELRVPFGYWVAKDAKDAKDDLDEEIAYKFKRGYTLRRPQGGRDRAAAPRHHRQRADGADRRGPAPRAALRLDSGPLEAVMEPTLVSRDPELMSGALCFTGTRVLVKSLFDYLEGGSTLEDFLQDFPSVSRQTAVAVLEAARERLAIDAPAA